MLAEDAGNYEEARPRHFFGSDEDLSSEVGETGEFMQTGN
jgi:hypothetical protein